MDFDAPASPKGSNDNVPGSRARWVFRKLWPRDAGALTIHLLRLDTEQRAFRFGYAVSDAWIEAYCAGTDWTRSVTLGCWIAGELRGVAELKLLDRGWPPSAEAALSVDRAFESRGMGTELCRRGLVIARNRGVSRVFMLCLPENRRIRRLIARFNPKYSFNGDQVDCEIALRPADGLSIAAELCDDGCALMQSLWDWQEVYAPAA
jgi:RimJ/RimL family protein N-acetyltransferase